MRTKSVVETQINNFFSEINNYIQKINKEEGLNERLWNRVLLEEFIKSKFDGDVKTHPYFLLCSCFEEEAMQEVNKCNETDGGNYKDEIRREIVQVRCRNYSRLQVYFDLTDYIAELDENNDAYTFVPFKEYGSLTEIQDYRLIEKIESLYKSADFSGKVKIAYFGTLKRTKAFEEYFKEKGVDVQFDEYRYVEKPWFECKEKNIKISVKKMADLCNILKEYDMILFLNESYFYKNRQSDQTSVEQNASLFVDWYWKRYLDTPSEHGFSLEKIMCLFEMYHNILQFQTNIDETLSGEYEFNANLLSNLEIVSEHTMNSGDVYIYMQNERVANRNIDERDVCKEEYYDGQNLYVYKISSNNGRPIDKLNRTKIIDRHVSAVDVWKLIKSISNLYYEKYWQDKYSISQLKNSKIEFVGGKQKDKDNFWVYYQLSGDFTDEIKKFVEEIFELSSEKEPIECVRKYIKDMVYGAVLAHAMSVEGLVLSNKIHTSRNVYFEERASDDSKKSELKLTTYSERKAYYNVIDHLNYLRIHDFDQAKRILQYNFKPYIASDLSDDEFEEFMREINSVCKKYGDTESRIFYYSEVFC